MIWVNSQSYTLASRARGGSAISRAKIFGTIDAEQTSRDRVGVISAVSGDVMPYKAVRVGRRDLLREAIRAEKRRMLARLSREYGPGRDRLLRELAAANELITWFDARRTLEGANGAARGNALIR